MAAIVDLFDTLWENLNMHLYIIICTVIMFYLQKRRARKIFRYHRETVVVFTKYPVQGKAKTRLAPVLGDNGASRAHLLMTDHIVDRLLEYQTSHPDLSIDVHYTGGSEDLMHAWLGRRSEHARGSLTWSLQRGPDLGSRMKNALFKHLASGEDRVVIIGSDIPGIEVSDIEEAMKAMRREDHVDMSLGQAMDGGYYLIGGNTNIMPHLGGLFEGIKWGTDSVFVEQRLKALKLGLRLHILKRKLQDIDEPEDLDIMRSSLDLTKEDLFYPRWSIVIPTLNEGENITTCITHTLNNCHDKSKLEMIVVDGGSVDDTCDRVTQAAATSPVPITLVHSNKGRGLQLRAGADKAGGFYLLFLHADTRLPVQFTVPAEAALSTPGVSLAAFKLGFDVCLDPAKRNFHSKIFFHQMRLIQYCADLRSRFLELPYGDQALCMTRHMYRSVGGFPDWPLLEDLKLVRDLQKKGRVEIVPGPGCITSTRRWEKYGAFKTTFLTQIVLIGYALGVSPQRLALWYYGKPKTD